MTICDVSTLEEWRQNQPNPEAQRVCLQTLQTESVVDPAFHAAVAEWAEELDEFGLALREWNMAHRDQPSNPHYLERLVESYLDRGLAEKALRFATQLTALNPASVNYWEQRIALEHELRREEAVDSQKRAFLLTDDVRFQGRLNAEPSETKLSPFDDTFLILLQETFAGREGVYALQWVDENDRTGYSPVKKPLGLQDLKNHLQGNHTLGIYPLRMDNTIHFAALDLDLSPVVVRNCRPGTAGWKEAFLALETFALELLKRAASDGVTLHLAESGYKGLHLWALFKEPVPAKMARLFLKKLVEPLAVPPVMRCEIFPKQNSVPPDGLGNLIKMPLGIHRKTGKRAWFRGPDQELEAQRLWLQKARRVDKECLVKAYRLYLDEQAVEPNSRPLSPDTTARQQLELAWEPDYDLNSDPEVQEVLSRCVTLRALVEKSNESSELSHDEARVLIHTLGHLATGPLAVNSILGRCMEADSSLYLKRPLRGNPMSCARIRARIPEVTSLLPCDCHFASSAGLYPTPALHLSQTQNQIPLNQLQFQALLQDFLRAKKELYRLRGVLESHAQRLNTWFDEAGQEELDTSMGRFRRLVSQDGEVSFELLV